MNNWSFLQQPIESDEQFLSEPIHRSYQQYSDSEHMDFLDSLSQHSNKNVKQQNNEEQLQQQLNEECPLCFNVYNEHEYQPMFLCKKNNHLCCKFCVNKMFGRNKTIPCPMCRVSINYQDVSVFRLYSEYIKKILTLSKTIKENSDKLQQLEKQLVSNKEQYQKDMSQKVRELSKISQLFQTQKAKYLHESKNWLQHNNTLENQLQKLKEEIRNKIKQNRQLQISNINYQNKIKELTSLYKTTQESKDNIIIGYQAQNNRLLKQNKQLKQQNEALQREHANKQTDLIAQNKILHNQISDFLKINDKQRWQMQAEEFFRRGKLEVAAEIFMHLVEISLQQQFQIYGLGCVQDIKGYYQGREEQIYFDLIKNKELRINPYDGLSICFLKKRNFETAKLWYSKMLTGNPENPYLLFGLANTFYNLSQFKQAERMYRKVLGLKSSFDKPYQLIASIYYNTGSKQENATTISLCKDCLSLNPSNIYSKFMLAVLEQDGSSKQKLLLKIIKDNPLFVRAKSALASYYILAESTELGIQLSKECISKNPYYDRPYLNIGYTYQSKQMNEQAMGFYIKCLEVNPLNQDPYLSMAKLYLKVGKMDKAIQKMEQVLQLNPNFKKGLQLMAKIYFKKGDFAQSISYYEKCIFLDEQNDKYYQMMADIYYFNLNHHKKAQEYYEKCRNINPQNLQSTCQLKIINYNSGIRPRTSSLFLKQQKR